MGESSPRPDASLDQGLDRAIALAAEALAVSPCGLLTDFDGTLSPIVTDAASARLVEGASEALEILTARLAVVAVVTGRAPLDARRMTNLPGLLIAGNHGTEWLEPDAETVTASEDAQAARGRVAAVLARVPAADGVMVEDKGVSATVHYRSAPDPEASRLAILEGIGDPGAGVELRPGRMSVEIRPSGLGDKGVATRTIVERFGLRGAVVMGDDVTDLDMFRAVAEARSAGRLRAAVIGVGGTDGEVPPEVVAEADAVLEGPQAAARFLAALAAG